MEESSSEELTPGELAFRELVQERLNASEDFRRRLEERLKSGREPYDDYGPRDLLMNVVECKDVVEYIIATLPEGGNGIRALSNMCYGLQFDDNLVNLMCWLYMESPVEIRPKILENVGKIYLDNSMPEKHAMVIRAQERINRGFPFDFE